MADFCDRAQRLEENFREAALAAATTKTARHGENFCVGCGDEIPKARRKAMTGCDKCIDCQEKGEGLENGL